MKSVVLMIDLLLFSPQTQTRIKDISGLCCNCRLLIPIILMGVAKCPLCKVVWYCAGSNGTEISVRYTEQRGVRCSGVLDVQTCMEITLWSEHSEMSIIMKVPAVEGCPLTGIACIPLMTLLCLWTLCVATILQAIMHMETLLQQLSDLSLALSCKNIQAIITCNWP